MLDDIFANNEKRLRALRKEYSADSVASLVNDRLKEKGVSDRVSGPEIDAFLKVADLGKNRALVPHKGFKEAMAFAKDSGSDGAMVC
ncbi:hypothetical protein [Marinomonas gallaica]|uniref:hypothetical protein n=1 Tax=Marinomonas gallaica TaxID=1806667 RepID=UPI00082AA693|nr:hypothetical protein [Marinomonas gallaica]